MLYFFRHTLLLSLILVFNACTMIGSEMMMGCSVEPEYPESDLYEQFVEVEIKHQTLLTTFTVGNARLYIDTEYGQLTQIRVEGRISIFGYKESIDKTITVSKMQDGESLPLGLQSSPILLIEPQSISGDGGSAILRLKRDGGNYSTEDLMITKSEEGSFDVLVGGESTTKLTVFASGLSKEHLKIASFKIE